MNYKKVTIYTQVYNTKKYLRQCLDSVVNQSYPIHQYIIVDNGCTDGCSEIIQEYAEKYGFIEVIKHETNKRAFWHKVIAEKATGDYIMTLDSDDWLELNCLEKTFSEMENGGYDIVAVSSRFRDENSNELGFKKVENTIDMDKNGYSAYYPYYHSIFRTIWAKLYKKTVFLKSVENLIARGITFYGGDTFFAFSALRNSRKVLVLSDVLHNYTIHEKSVSHQYDPKQSDSDIFLFNDAIDFLSQYGEISVQNMQFIHIVYANAIKDTANNLVNSKLSAQEKLKEYIKIFARPETHNALSIKNDTIENVKCELMFGLLSFAIEIKADFDKVSQILNILSPACSSVINKDTVKLFARNDNFKALLFKDDKNLLSEYLLTLVLNNDKLTKVYDFPLMLGNLASENSLASTVKSVEFIRLYSDVYSLVWNAKNIEALDKMTEIMLSGEEVNCAEDFLNLYVTLAALENQVDAFLFGNIQKAYLFIDEKRFDEAKQIVNDLIEMGAGESEDVVELVRMLNAE